MAEVEVDHRMRSVSLDCSQQEMSLLSPGPKSPRVLHPPPATAVPAVRTLVEQKALVECFDQAFFVADLGAIVRQHNKWHRLLPRVVSCSITRQPPIAEQPPPFT